jgi:hypothetical protein
VITVFPAERAASSARLHQHGAETRALVSVHHLRVGDDDAVTGGAIVQPPSQLAVDAQLDRDRSSLSVTEGGDVI